MILAHYGRYSSNNQRETSLEDQLRRCLEYSVSHGHTIPAELIFQDRAISGANMAGREAFMRLLSLAFSSEPTFQGIIVDSLSRLSRDLGDMHRLFKRLQFRRIHLISVADGIDSIHKTAKLSVAVKGIVNEIFLDDLREATRRGLEGRFLAGFSPGGRTYGYTSEKVIDPGRTDAHGEPYTIGYQLKVVPGEAEVVREIFFRFAHGHSEKAIAKDFNARGLGGKVWSPNVIYAMLQNTRYFGHFHFNRKEWHKNPDTGKRVYIHRPREEWYHRHIPELAIIDEKAWQACEERLA